MIEWKQFNVNPQASVTKAKFRQLSVVYTRQRFMSLSVQQVSEATFSDKKIRARITNISFIVSQQAVSLEIVVTRPEKARKIYFEFIPAISKRSPPKYAINK